MGVPLEEYRIALGRYPSLAVQDKDEGSNEVTVVTVEVRGIRGGEGDGSEAPVMYRLFVDVSDIRLRLPGVWVLGPPEGLIRHVNVYPPEECPRLHRDLPKLCWGNYPEQWADAETSRRTLAGFLEDVRQHLNHQNFDSPARPY